jgi:3-phenylpropionate/trans-cinnamate dioxygenase ferredoxin subunit
MSLDTTFQRACSEADLMAGTAVAVRIGQTPIVVVRAQDGTIYAAYDECSHAQVALSEGEVDGCTLECWLHGSRFDLRTGEPTGLPATQPIPVYPVQIRDGDVFVSLASSNGVSL